jgi:hypothetical protein
VLNFLVAATPGTETFLSCFCTSVVQVPSKHGILTDLNLENLWQFCGFGMFNCSVIRRFQRPGNMDVIMPMINIHNVKYVPCNESTEMIKSFGAHTVLGDVLYNLY